MVSETESTLSIIVLTRNEEKNITALLEDLNNKVSSPFEIIVIDDSTDATADIVREQCARFSTIRLIRQKEKGHGHAIMEGIESSQRDFVVIVTGDLSDHVEDINRMKELIGTGYDIVCASRYYMKRARDIRGVFPQSLLSFMLGKSLNLLLRIPTCDATNSFKMYRKAIFNHLKIIDSGYATSMQIILKSFFKGYKIAEIPTYWKKRTIGKSKFSFRKQQNHYIYWFLWALAKRVVTQVVKIFRREHING